MWLSYVATLVSASLPAVFAALCVFWIARGVGVSDAGAAFAAVVCALGTPLWAYGSILYGHALAAGCLMAAFWGAGRLPASARRPALGLFIGFAAGWAVVAEYPAAVAAVVIGGFSVWQVRRGPRAQAAATIAAISLGAAVAAACLLFYNRMAFGSMFHIGYASEVPGFEEMQRGIFGISWPTVHVMGAVVIGQYRGLLPLAPVLIAAPLGLWMLVRSGSTRAVGVTAAVVAGVYYLMASGYAYWNGGWSYGPRHLGPAIPFLCVGLAVIWQRASRPWRIALAVLAVISIGETLVAVATTPQPTTNVSNPMRDLLWPAFASGEFPIGWQSVLDFRPPEGTSTELLRAGVPRPSWNLGQQLGLHGHASLLPLMFIWLLGVLAWRRTPAA
jgi:hypothetical protein